jgi:hypothetical protein
MASIGDGMILAHRISDLRSGGDFKTLIIHR